MRHVTIFLFFLMGFTVDAARESMHVYGMILAGGVGTRLWPLSREDSPKQFLSVGTSKSLLEQSIDRLSGLIESQNIWGITSQVHSKQFAKTAGDLLGNIVVEPSARNTGPAVLVSCLELYKKDPEAVVVFVPADPYIPENDYELFRDQLEQTIAFASRHDAIVLCGARPTFPAMGYGYIEYVQESAHKPVFLVERFHEKPSLSIAQNYIQQPHMLWNIGMFVGKVSVFIEEFKNVASDLYEEVMQYQEGNRKYEEITSISVDCAVIERSNRVWVRPVDFSWCDVGNLDILLSIKKKDADSLPRVISVESHNNLIDVENKLVALVGVNDLCVIETADALLISKREDAEKVRDVVAYLKRSQLVEYL